jgi:ankyrin repeat protein
MIDVVKRLFIYVAIFFLAKTATAQPGPAVRAAVTRALPILQKSAGEFVAQRACFSCHHNALSILTLHAARDRGFAIDSKILTTVEDKTFRPLRSGSALDDAVQAVDLSDPTPNESLLLMSAHAAAISPDLTTAVYAARMTRWQRDGHWVTSDFRPPHSSSLFTATATAVRAIRFYMPQELAAERDTAIASARKWLFSTVPESTEDAAFRVMGLVWADAPQNEKASAAHDLSSLQKHDGGWPQLPGYDSDAYSTGEALFALREAGVPASDPEWQKGLKFLLSTQARDGTWHIRTRMLSPAEVSPMYFSTGFPYGKDEFISYAGSCWAVMALLTALPDPPSSAVGNSVVVQTNAPSWVRPALFGSARELAALLDSGLDPNSKTPNGTTLLMMAAPDPEKVRLLIARNVDVKVRAGSGTDALTVAAVYRGTAGSLERLLNAGAEVQASQGVRTRHSPLVFASMTGDLENVRLLLSHGAQPSAEALSEAVTFGYPDVVQALIRAGADSTITESSGINLLHWATITNRSAVIPVLAAAHVPLNAKDDFGFTPLLYAVTLDNGTTDTLKELLKAGADRRVRNSKGRTPLEEARRYKHPRLADALK